MDKNRRYSEEREVGYYDESFERREGRVLERNGNLTLVEDSETGEERYLAPFEME